MPKIVISYRRRDSGAITGRIFDRLVARYGRDAVFRDIDNIPAGVDFRTHIADAVHNSNLMLAVVGPNWVGRPARGGARRIDDASDLVRVEVETALQANIPVIPLLLGSARMPSAGDLPDSLRDFAYRNALNVDPGQDFDRHIDRLTREIDRALGADIAAGEPPTISPSATPTAVVDEVESLLLSDKPSLAVLPFQNMSGDPEQEYFADGIVEEITTAITRFPWLSVIARNSAFTYKGRAVDVRQMARELRVRYVLEGSVRKAGNRVRITGQLIDTTTGAHIWADRFDGSLDDIFDLQDQVASHVVVAIEPRLRLIESDRASRKPTDNLDAYDLYLRAQAENYKRTKEGFAESIRLARRALELDPGFALAMSRIAISRHVQMLMHSIPASGPEVDEGIHMARQALAVASDNPEVLRNAAVALAGLAAGENETALAALDRAVELNPNYAQAHAQRSYLLAWLNRPDEAIAVAERAVRLSPNDPVAFEPHHALCLAQLAAGRYEEALSSADVALRRSPGVPLLRLKLSLLGHLSRREEARECLQRLREIIPEPTIATLIRAGPRGMSPELVGRIAEGLRKAGLPDG